jgi:hypothetical protein
LLNEQLKEYYGTRPLTLQEFMFIIDKYDKDRDDALSLEEFFSMLLPYWRRNEFTQESISQKLHEASKFDNEDVTQFAREFKYTMNINKNFYGTGHMNFAQAHGPGKAGRDRTINLEGRSENLEGSGACVANMPNSQFLKIKNKNLAPGFKTIRDQVIGNNREGNLGSNQSHWEMTNFNQEGYVFGVKNKI